MNHLPTPGKNALWTAYKEAGPVKHTQILVDLKEAGLHVHWLGVASKAGYDLHNAKAPLRDIFLKYLPETAPLFGVELPGASGQAKKHKSVIVNAPTLFD